LLTAKLASALAAHLVDSDLRGPISPAMVGGHELIVSTTQNAGVVWEVLNGPT